MLSDERVPLVPAGTDALLRFATDAAVRGRGCRARWRQMRCARFAAVAVRGWRRMPPSAVGVVCGPSAKPRQDETQTGAANRYASR
jgi:hypothetical protein